MRDYLTQERINRLADEINQKNMELLATHRKRFKYLFGREVNYRGIPYIIIGLEVHHDVNFVLVLANDFMSCEYISLEEYFRFQDKYLSLNSLWYKERQKGKL